MTKQVEQTATTLLKANGFKPTGQRAKVTYTTKAGKTHKGTDLTFKRGTDLRTYRCGSYRFWRVA